MSIFSEIIQRMRITWENIVDRGTNQLMEIIISAVIVGLGNYIIKCWRYYRDINGLMTTLKNDLQVLNYERSDIQKLIGEQHEPGTEVKANVKSWLDKVEGIEKDIKIIEVKVREVKCFCRSRLGDDVVQKIQEVKELLLQGRTFPERLVTSCSEHRLLFPLPTIIECGSGTTFGIKVEEIWTSLLDREVTKIGVYGMAGIGKTTALELINNRIVMSKYMFDNVIWVTVSSDSSIASLQDKIAGWLHLTFSNGESKQTRASRLCTRLDAKKKFVLILDDVWEPFQLSEVGVPDPTPENGCKVVVTTRSIDVCNGMQINKKIEIERRSNPEAIKLFKDAVGDQVRNQLLSDQNLGSTMEQIVQECAGLPLAIVITARRLSGITDRDEWKFVLDQLRELERETDLSKRIIGILKSSYEHLDEEHQRCLLYCALFPEDHEIQTEFLIEHLIAEKIIENKGTRESETRYGRVMLKKLQDFCLLNGTIDRDGAKCVKMHDLIRDMALQIASKRYKYLVKKPGLEWESILDEDKWKQDLQMVSLANVRTTSLSSRPPNCPKVLTLFLYESYELNSISNEFFLHMKALSVLNLSFTSLEKLPESISDLVNLTALFLRKCHNMRCVPSLVKLIKLRKLDFYHSGINLIPEGLEMLVNLRYLNFDGCPLYIMPSRVLQKLTNLQYLVLPHSHQESKTETWRLGSKTMFYDGHSYSAHQGPKVKAEDLKLLTKLETFEGVFYDVNSFNSYVESLQQKRLTRYIYHLGFSNSYVHYASDQDHNKIVFLTGNLGSSTSMTGRECLLFLPKDINVLTIHHCHSSVSSLCGLTSDSDASKLWLCHVEDCGGIEHLFSYTSRERFPLFPELETLNLDGVRDLRGFIKWEGSFPLPHGFFSTLKELSMCNCNNVKALFIFKVASLPNLEQLTLSRCEKLEAIVSTNEEEIIDQASIVITLPKVRRIILSKLPKLQNVPVITDSLQEIHIDECPMLRKIDPLIDREQCPVSLMHVYIDRDTWGRLEWDCHNAKDFVMSLMNLTHDSEGGGGGGGGAGAVAAAPAVLHRNFEEATGTAAALSWSTLEEEEVAALFRRNFDVVIALFQWNFQNLEEVYTLFRWNFQNMEAAAALFRTNFRNLDEAAAFFQRNLEVEEKEEVALFQSNLEVVLVVFFGGGLKLVALLQRNLKVEVCFGRNLEVTSLFWTNLQEDALSEWDLGEATAAAALLRRESQELTYLGYNMELILLLRNLPVAALSQTKGVEAVMFQRKLGDFILLNIIREYGVPNAYPLTDEAAAALFQRNGDPAAMFQRISDAFNSRNLIGEYGVLNAYLLFMPGRGYYESGYCLL